ncbi:MAG: alpha/beta hydrolase [Sphingobium sp. 32-64-5]|nr:MAG: alpha/beta hydrolase [Sphingobium sp. 32-64-5]
MSALLILPGLICDSRMFAAQIDAFPGAVAVDGFYEGCDRIEAMADYALARAPERFALLGHSMGARVALEVIRKAPERVERIALADTGIHPVKSGEAEKRHALRDIGRDRGMAALVDAWLPPMVGTSHRGDDALIASMRAMSIDAGQDGFERQIEALLHRPDTDAVLRGIAVPAFAIVGDEDEWSPVDQHVVITERIPGAQLRVVNGAGHMAPAEEPHQFNQILREWLDWPLAS